MSIFLSLQCVLYEFRLCSGMTANTASSPSMSARCWGNRAVKILVFKPSTAMWLLQAVTGAPRETHSQCKVTPWTLGFGSASACLWGKIGRERKMCWMGFAGMHVYVYFLPRHETLVCPLLLKTKGNASPYVVCYVWVCLRYSLMASHLVSIEMNTTGIFLPVSKHMSSFFFFNECMPCYACCCLFGAICCGWQSQLLKL